MIRRRQIVALFLASPLMALAQSKRVPRVGVVFYNVPLRELQPPSPSSPLAKALIEGLAEKGWAHGRNLELHWRSSEGQYDRLPGLVEELHRLPIDLLVASGNDIATKSIKRSPLTPVVLGSSDFPVENGLAKSMARPGGNITGLTNWVGSGLNAKRLSLLKQAAPATRKVAIVAPRWSSDTPRRFSPETQAAADSLGIEIFLVSVENADQVDDAFAAAVRSGANAVFVLDYPLAFVHAAQANMAQAAIRHKLPAIHSAVNAGESGALLAYGPDIFSNFRRAGYYVDRILRGAKAGDLPIEQPDKLELVVNLKAAKAIGLVMPGPMVLQATRVIE